MTDTGKEILERLKDIQNSLTKLEEGTKLRDRKYAISEPPGVIKKWYDAGKVKYDGDDKWRLYETPLDFCFWLFNSMKLEDIPPAEFCAENLNNSCALNTWKKYYRDAGITKKSRKER
ncbi:MAG: hypothetical protein MdMp014T_0733 [Treponematales bacterium]